MSSLHHIQSVWINVVLEPSSVEKINQRERGFATFWMSSHNELDGRIWIK